MIERPSVSVIVPFAGPAAEVPALLRTLGAIERRAGDELFVVLNRAQEPPIAAEVTVLRAPEVHTPGFARNRGAREATGEWLVFIDADTEPEPPLLDAYFDPPPRAETAVLAGGILDIPGGGGIAARRSTARGQMADSVTLGRAGRPYAQSANCAVRRSAFAAAGGFDDHARAGEDADLCFRLADAGWALEHRPRALVRHRTRAGVTALLTQLARHGSGAAWLDRRYPGEFPAPRPRALAGRLAREGAAALAAARRRDREEAARSALDVLCTCAYEGGRLLPNVVAGP